MKQLTLNQNVSFPASVLNHLYTYTADNPIRHYDLRGLDLAIVPGEEGSYSLPDQILPFDPFESPCTAACFYLTLTCGMTDGPAMFIADVVCSAVAYTYCANEICEAENTCDLSDPNMGA